MDVDDYRQLRLLAEISSGETVTQRRLAKKHGLALGLTNFLIRRLIRKGYVKIVNLERKRLRYLITPKGLAEKARLTYGYLEYSLALYRSIRTLVTRTLATIQESGGRKVALYGTGEVAEIAVLLMQERGLDVVAVVDDAPNGKTSFMQQSIRSLSELARVPFDWVLVASFTDKQKIVQQLCRSGVPEEKIITTSETGAMDATLRRTGSQAILETPEAIAGAGR